MEASFYAVEGVQSISELKVDQDKRSLQVLRVMHCSQLTELKGIGGYPNLRELNASSNSILTMSGLDELKNLEMLNLSCNKIAQVFGLRQMAKSLKTLNLSHNRIVSLLPL
jgi:Leucine-rich repeat (LRR) protein